MPRSLAVWMVAAALAAPVAVRAEGDGDCRKACCRRQVEVQEVVTDKGRCDGGGYMGVALREVPPKDLEALKLAEQGAARVERVSPDSPAAEAGFKEGDIVVRFDGAPVSSARQLARAVAEAAPGRRVKVEVRRAAELVTLSVPVGQKDCRELHPRTRAGHHGLSGLPEIAGRLPEIPGDLHELLGDAGGPRRLGIRYQPATGQLARYFRLDRDSGLLVTHVDEGSPAEKAGVKAGDVVLAIDGKDVSDAGDLRRRVASAESGDVRLRVQRDGKPVDVTVTLRPRPALARPDSTT